MSIVGNNYYRCGTRFYYIPIGEKLVFDYSLQKNTFGDPIRVNEIYRKVSGKGFFLSPYAMWKIKLIRDDSISLNTGHFDVFDDFKNIPIDLKLVGQGQYVKNEKSFLYGICNSKLEQHYHFDGTEEFSTAEIA